ncbi:MAG TPA: hypothetical protein VF584_16100 [Longimicrobium sp.]|jgi:hypothetical protein
MCADAQNSSSNAPVPDFEAVGFGDAEANDLTQAHAALGDVKALSLQVCVSATYDPGTKQICFTIPIYGQKCVTSPIGIPVGGAIKACAQTCGSPLPHGVRVSFYLNKDPAPFYTKVFGRC